MDSFDMTLYFCYPVLWLIGLYALVCWWPFFRWFVGGVLGEFDSALSCLHLDCRSRRNVSFVLHPDAALCCPVGSGLGALTFPQAVYVSWAKDGNVWLDFGARHPATFFAWAVRYRIHVSPHVLMVTGRLGKVERMVVDYRAIRSKGIYFCVGLPEWPKYVSSVAQAHVETMKFGLGNPSRYPNLAARILKVHAVQIFTPPPGFIFG